MQIVLVLVTLLALACAQRGQPAPQEEASPRLQLAESAPADTWQGIYVLGRRTNLFTPCGSSERYWVLATNEMQRDLRVRYAHATAMPLQPAYVELRGAPAGRATEGAAAEADGVFRVDEVLVLRKTQPGDCDPEAKPAS
jgi:hypothetical protein